MPTHSHCVQSLSDDSVAYRVIRATECPKTPWKNGGGSTKELMLWPADAGLDNFDWRISVADVEAEGPFSVFTGVQRHITLLKGDAMLLNNNITGQSHLLTPLKPYEFSGEDDITAYLPHGATQDFNVMVRRSSGLHATVQCIAPNTQLHLTPAAHLLYCIDGPCTVGNPTINRLVLNTGDSVYFPPAISTTPNKQPYLSIRNGRYLHVTLSPTI